MAICNIFAQPSPLTIHLVSHYLLLPGPSTMCSTTHKIAGTTLLRPLQTALSDWHWSDLEDTLHLDIWCSSGMEGLSRRAPASKALSAWISNKNMLQSCLSCSRVCDGSTLHSPTTAHFLQAQAGCSHLESNSAGTEPPGRALRMGQTHLCR